MLKNIKKTKNNTHHLNKINGTLITKERNNNKINYKDRTKQHIYKTDVWFQCAFV